MTTRRFANSFHKKVKHPPNDPAALKWHYKGIMREIVGYFDAQARRDPERFVYANYETVLAGCKKFGGDRYSESAFWQALRELRERRIISKQVERERWVPVGKKGHKVLRKLKGCIVVPHDCVCRMVGDECEFVGPLQACGRWKRTGDAGPSSVLFWNGCTDHSAVVSAVPNTVASAVVSTVPSTVSTSVQAADEAGTEDQNSGLSRLAVEADAAARTVPAVPAGQTTQPKAGGQGRQDERGGASLSQKQPQNQTPTAWQEFTKAATFLLCDEMLYASPKPGEHEKVLGQLAALGGDVEDFCDEINEWAAAQSPPLNTLHYGRWTRWLEQSSERIAQYAELLRQQAARKTRNT